MKIAQKIRQIFPGSVAANTVFIVIGVVMAVIPLTPGVPGKIALLLTGLGTAAFLAGFIGLINTVILAEEFRKVTEQPMETLNFITKIHSAGISDVFRSRADGVDKVLKSLEYEKRQLVIAGTSLKGVVGIAFDEEHEYQGVWDALKDALRNKVRINILMTHPEAAYYRAQPEGRLPGEIEAEILDNLIYLVMFKAENPKIAEYLNIKLYSGAPTVFLMASSHKMLVNPYPYYATGSSSFSFLVECDSAMYNSYYNNHYRAAWLDSKLTLEIKHDPAEAVKQIQELINMNGHEKNSLLIPDETKRNSMLQTLYTMLQN
ncbi:MAG TPA: hypothetical protein VHY08_04310 [Bacillota bacterium]|nr:hypothetical protein [Bacillota bacterium]